MATEKHKVEVFSASVMVGEKNLINKNNKNLFHIGGDPFWSPDQMDREARNARSI